MSWGSLVQVQRVAAQAERLLNRSFDEFCKNQLSEVHREFLELKLQSALVQYEISYVMLAFLRSSPDAFSRKVTLKDLVHKIYEYDRTLRGSHTKRILSLAERRGLSRLRQRLSEASSRWRKELSVLKQYADLRNNATGHYTPNIKRQVGVIAALDQSVVLDAVRIFLSFNTEVLAILRAIGRNVHA